MAVVAHESHIAGMHHTIGLKFCGPSSMADLPLLRVDEKTCVLMHRERLMVRLCFAERTCCVCVCVCKCIDNL